MVTWPGSEFDQVLVILVEVVGKIFASTQPLGSESADDVIARVSQFLPPGPLETCSFQTRIKMFDLESLSSIQYVAALGLGVGGEYLRSSVKVERANICSKKKDGPMPCVDTLT